MNYNIKNKYIYQKKVGIINRMKLYNWDYKPNKMRLKVQKRYYRIINKVI